ncbi:MAG: mechanosensitive ion channel, partial [Eubacteriales bacterium]|nr:mechanosensitive ion channel [Eubacteriales bacterium]
MAEIFQDDSINMLEKISRFFGDTLLGRIAFVVIVCLAAWAGISIIVHVLRSLLHKSRIDDVGNVMILRITRILLWILVIMSLLSSLGVKMAPFVTMLATAGAAVALALRDSLANLASGIILLVTHPFGKDDKIEVNGAVGSVVAIDIMTTTLLTVSGKRVTVPNSMMTSNIVTNHTSGGRTQAEKQHILSRSSDILKAEEIIRSVIDEEPLILAEPKP